MGYSKEHKSPSGGLNEKGRKYFNNKDGGNLKAPLNSGVSARRISFAARFAGMDGPMRKALALKKWGFASVEAARNFANKNKKSSQA